MLVLALVGGFFVVLGTFLPWVQVGALLVNRGIDNPDGAITLIVGIAACALCIFALVRKASRAKWPGVLLAALAAVSFCFAVVDLGDVHNRVAAVRDTFFGDAASTGAGLYLVLIGAVVLGIGGIGSLFTRTGPSLVDRLKKRYGLSTVPGDVMVTGTPDDRRSVSCSCNGSGGRQNRSVPMAERWRVARLSALARIRKWLSCSPRRWCDLPVRVRLVILGVLCVVVLSVVLPLVLLRADRIVGHWTSIRVISASSASALPPGDFWDSMTMCAGDVNLSVAKDHSFFWDTGGRRVEGAWKFVDDAYTTCDTSYGWYGRAWITKKGTLFWSQTDLKSSHYVLYAFYRD